MELEVIVVLLCPLLAWDGLVQHLVLLVRLSESIHILELFPIQYPLGYGLHRHCLGQSVVHELVWDNDIVVEN